MWGGRFRHKADAALARLNASLPFDWRLAPYDLWQNRVYCDELARLGVLDADERIQIARGFDTIEQELREGRFPYELAHEDIHMNLEARLTALIGEAGGKIHTGRSRNDQVATVTRMWMRDAVAALAASLRELIETTLARAEREADLPCPGYTHLQRAQVISFGHHLHAYAEMFVRDRERLLAIWPRLNVCPLGNGALAGAGFALDRQALARHLGFDATTDNSLDGVSDRDFIYEFLAVAALIGVHLSRWAEDVILWASAEFGWIDLPDAFATGSSMMPQKKNPDLAELARGKAGRLLAHSVQLGTALKGLPLTYNKDLQEDKEALFDAEATLRWLLAAWTPMIAQFEVRPDAMRRGLERGHVLATDLADALVRRAGVPFREAHRLVGRAVQQAEANGCDVAALSPAALAEIDPRFQTALDAPLTPERALAARTIDGGPAPDNVRRQVARTRRRLDAQATPSQEVAWALELSPPAAWAY